MDSEKLESEKNGCKPCKLFIRMLQRDTYIKNATCKTANTGLQVQCDKRTTMCETRKQSSGSRHTRQIGAEMKKNSCCAWFTSHPIPRKAAVRKISLNFNLKKLNYYNFPKSYVTALGGVTSLPGISTNQNKFL